MTREAVVDVVTRNIRMNVDGLPAGEIDTSRSMKELGASSLDIVEIVSGSMRELRIRVPRTELAKLKNVDDLVDLFVRSAAAA
ncbi:MAG TPA: phosphopantetheine-binding protein [Longimicrobiaceae bacterium]|nr:phosphopantetheine-binding protein [Longimicrobiaceae bacterium]